MAVIGSATLNIVPKVVGGLANAINGEIAKANVAGKGKSAGGTFMGGFASGASIGIWSSIASKAIDVVTGSLDSAAARVDTLNNYPRIMSSLGVETEVARRSIDTMGDALQNVPTRLDSMASTVQGLHAATTKYGTSLDTVTDAGLALNSMLLAGGQSQEVVNASMEQFRQMVAKGKPDLQDWRSLISAAPGQMNQLAEAMLGATATADDLYAALGGGKESDYGGPFEWGSLGMDEFIAKFAEMRGRFEEAAVAAQGGIQTSLSNMKNAVTRGVAGILESIGQDRIASAIGDVKTGINAMFKDLESVMPDVVPVMDGAWASLKASATEAAPIVSGIFHDIEDVALRSAPSVSAAFTAVFDGLKGAAPVVSGVVDATGKLVPIASSMVQALAPAIPLIAGMKAVSGVVGTAQAAISTFGGAAASAMGSANTLAGKLRSGLAGVAEGILNAATLMGDTRLSSGMLNLAGGVESLSGKIGGPLVAGAMAAVGGLALLYERQVGLERAARKGDEAISGFSAAIERSGALDGYRGSLESTGQAMRDTTDYLADMTQRWQRHADAISSNDATATETIGTWQRVRDVLAEAAGATDLSAEARGRLEWALRQYNDATGEAVTVEDAIRGSYESQEGAVRSLREEVEKLSQARIEEARQNAYQQNLEEAYRAQADAQNEVADAQSRFNDVYQGYLSRAREGKYHLEGLTAEQFAYQAALSDSASVTVDVNGETMLLNDAIAQSSQHLQQANDAISRYTAALGEGASGASQANDAYDRLVASGTLLESCLRRQGASSSEFAAQLRSLGGDVDGNAEKIANFGEWQLMQLASGFDGTAASIARCLESMGDWGGSFDDAAAGAADMEQSVSQVRLALEGMGTAALESQSSIGISMADLAARLAEAGVSSADLAAIGSENFAALAQSCSGNVDLMVSALAMYNAAPVETKSGEVVVNDAPLMDAMGKVYTYNGTALQDKSGTAVVEYKQLVDSTGAVFEWNGATLKPMSTTATATGNVISGQPTTQVNNLNSAMGSMRSNGVSATVSTNAGSAAGSIWNAVNAINSLYNRTVTVTTVYNQVGTPSSGHAAGGFRMHADGGYRAHASGAIVNAPGIGYPLDMVGEDGAEAIVPLTNRRYAKPFIDMLADALASRGGGDVYNIYAAPASGEDGTARSIVRALRARELMEG